VFWGHTSHEPEYVLGTASDLKVSDDGKQTTARLNFDTDINPKADLVFNQIKRGTLRTVSVGFMSGKMEMDAKDEDAPWILKDNELLEISVVPIPANPGAVALGLKSGDIKRKDAKWLMDSMRAEADLMQRQYEASKPKQDKSMTPEQATALIEGMTKLTEKVDALTAENQTLREQIEAEQKAREDAEAKAEEEKKAADEEAARKAEDDAKKDDPAKGGQQDQPGAGEPDVIDYDTELTPELQAQIDAELEAEDSNKQ
jgi:HK97 family phage prohead protease